MRPAKTTTPTTRQHMKERQIITEFWVSESLRGLEKLQATQKRTAEMMKEWKIGLLRIGLWN